MNLKTSDSISVFFPCYNDEKSIQTLVIDSLKILKGLTRGKYEVIVVDDGSTDNSRRVLHKLQSRYTHLRVHLHRKNKGYGGALRSGFKLARYKLIFYTDGDGQYSVKELPILLSLMSPDVSFINGIKMGRSDHTLRIIVGNLYSFIARWLFWLPIQDVDCDFRLIRRSLVRNLRLRCNSGAICIELVKKAERQGGKFRQVSIHHYERIFGKSQFFRPKRILYTLKDLFFLWRELMW